MNYLGRVIEKITKKSLSQLFKEEIAPAFGMKNTYFSYTNDMENQTSIGHFYQYPRDKEKYPAVDSPASSLHTEAGDFSNFLMGLLNKKYLSKASYDLISIPESPMKDSDKMYDLTLAQGMAYGFFVVETPEGKIIGHGGNNWDFECKYGIMPEKGVAYAVFTNSNFGDEFIRQLELYLLHGSEK